MTLACMFASLCFEISDTSNRNLVQAINFVRKAEDIQRKLIRAQKIKWKEVHDNEFTLQEATEQIIEDQIIQAFRHYTHGIITSNYFMLHEEKRKDQQDTKRHKVED